MKTFLKITFTVFSLLLTTTIFCQTEIRKLPANINQPSINLFAPSLSGDGESMIFLSDYTDDGSHSMYYTTKKSVSSWNDPVEVSKVVNRPTFNYRGGYSLSFEGDMLLFTSRKTGLGGFDLWYSKKEGNNWGVPKNFGSPINSSTNEGTASLSPDGEYLYFMRCSQMSEYKGASDCKLMVAKRKYDSWEQPVELPANINTGNSQNPKILADGNTLIFSSDQMGGKGGLELFMTKKANDGWSDPVSMDFMNTENDDQFISIPAKGRYLYTSAKDSRSFEIVQILIPEEFQPTKVMRIKGNVLDKNSGAPLNAQLIVFNISARDRLYNDKIGSKGEFAIVLNEGSDYDLAVKSPDNSYMYYSKIYSLDKIGSRDKESLKIELAPIEVGTEYELPIEFKANSAEPSDNSVFEMRRLADLARKNSNMQFDINIYQNNYLEDSVRSNPDLTEVIIDSVFIEKQIPVKVAIENLILPDSTEMDSLNSTQSKIVKTDSIIYETVKELVIKKKYHNDRTMQQGEKIKAFLIEKGAVSENINVNGIKKINEDADQAIIYDEMNKVTIKIIKL